MKKLSFAEIVAIDEIISQYEEDCITHEQATFAIALIEGNGIVAARRTIAYVLS